MREEVHQLYLRSSATASESDARHAHFISTLREAQRVLQPLQEARAAVAESACRPSAQISHSFAALEVEEPSAEPAEADSVAAASTVAIDSLPRDDDLDFATSSALPQLHAAMFLLDLDELQAQISTAWAEHAAGGQSLRSPPQPSPISASATPRGSQPRAGPRRQHPAGTPSL